MENPPVPNSPDFCILQDLIHHFPDPADANGMAIALVVEKQAIRLMEL